MNIVAWEAQGANSCLTVAQLDAIAAELQTDLAPVLLGVAASEVSPRPNRSPPCAPRSRGGDPTATGVYTADYACSPLTRG